MNLDPELADLKCFSSRLYELLSQLNPGIQDLELYEFRYALENITPEMGWSSVDILPIEDITGMIQRHSLFTNVEFKPLKNGHIVLDSQLLRLSQVLCCGLVSGTYSPRWVNSLFYFDIRAFVFFVHTQYFDQPIITHFGGRPFLTFPPDQDHFSRHQDIGLREFRAANHDLDQSLIQLILAMIRSRGVPLVITLVGPTGAGKTEITREILAGMKEAGISCTSIEMDNFYKDGAYRQGKALNRQVIHYGLFRQCLENLSQGLSAQIPRYNFLATTSSHDLQSQLRPGGLPIEVAPADVIFLEGNYPFHDPDVSPLIAIKIVYLTADHIRLKRKWRRDIDYRKKYDPFYFVNRYFRTQFLRAEEVYRPLLKVSDLVADTTAGKIWLTPGWQETLAPKIPPKECV